MTNGELQELLKTWPAEAKVMIKHNGGELDTKPLKGARLENPDGDKPGMALDIGRLKVILA